VDGRAIVAARSCRPSGRLENNSYIHPSIRFYETGLLRRALGFMGINDVGVVRAEESLAVNPGKVRIGDHLERHTPEFAALAES
jgi:hypothetical protein